MPLEDQFQTVVYYSDTGDIHAILQNRYIKSRKALNASLGIPESTGMKFFYVPGYYPLQKEDWIVEIGSKHRSPRLISRDGKDGGLMISQKTAAYILENYKEVIFSFEGGLGDYLDQADVVIACKEKYQNKGIKIVLDGSRIQGLGLLEGFNEAATPYNLDLKKSHTPTIEFLKINSLNANYKPEGKIGAYSTIAGLTTTAPRAKINIPEDDVKNARAIIQEKIGVEYDTIIALHTMSGNCNTKGILPGALPKLLSSILNKKGLYLLHFGGAGEEAALHKRIISLQGKLNWKQVFAVMSLCDGCICIDSAILHIAQHLNLPTVSFWGPTNAENILGTDPGVKTITTTLDCKGCNMYECRQSNCMENFEQKEIDRKIKKLIGK